MAIIGNEKYQELCVYLQQKGAALIAVSKLKSVADIRALYDRGQRDFGENYVQELLEKQPLLPKDIRWHFIGHLQRNKVKLIAPFVSVIHGVDSLRLLAEISAQAAKVGRTIDCLIQVHIADEETKFGLDEKEAIELMEHVAARPDAFGHVRIRGLMGMASFSEDANKVRAEFAALRALYHVIGQAYFLGKPYYDMLSMGMSGDYELALEEGSTHVRIGSLLFGERPSQ